MDNRCLCHAATWFDGAAAVRSMWRVTVSGDPGPFYTEGPGATRVPFDPGRVEASAAAKL